MYEYRKLTPEQKAELVQKRLSCGYPPHSPPHPVKDREYYLLTAVCFEHQRLINSPSRRQYLLNLIFDKFINNDIEIRAWVILPNHYHLLVYLHNFDILSDLFRRIHGSVSHAWNLEDNAAKRQVWYRWSDRAIRSQRHYYTTIN